MENKNKLPLAAQKIIEKLFLQKRYEGVYLKRVYASEQLVAGRSTTTSAYALAAYNAPSFLHSLDCDEIWHFYAGHPLDIYMFKDNEMQIIKFGADVLAGQQPKVVVKKGTIFGATVERSDQWCLFGCTCSPGFTIEGCEFFQSDHPLLQQYGQYKDIIQKLTKYEI